MNITGTIVNYYFHCKRQCWLFANRINLEDNSEDVHIGRVLHEIHRQDGKNNDEILLDNIKIDSISNDFINEMKKSDADMIAAKYQLLFYLKTLKAKGIERKGRLEICEKNTQNRKYHTYILTDADEAELDNIIVNISNLIEDHVIPSVEENRKCRKCAYYEYCYL